MPNKTQLLLTLLTNGRAVTRATALASLKIPNLSASISDLRRAGHRIQAVSRDDGSNTGERYTAWEYLGQARKAPARAPAIKYT